MKNTTNTSNGSTNTWKAKLIELFKNIQNDDELKSYYHDNNFNLLNAKVHLGVFNEPFLSLIFEEKKTIESRFSKNKISPFNKAQKGDIVFLKKSGGPISGFFIVKNIHYYETPSNEELNHIKKEYSEGICVNAVNDFWEKRIAARYISLLEIECTKRLKPFLIDKKDRLAWIVVEK
jgi:ASC-1-like (ASCH) protein